jgi:hypothetical protein
MIFLIFKEIKSLVLKILYSDEKQLLLIKKFSIIMNKTFYMI